MTFQQKLDNLVKKNNSLLCVGLDPDIKKIPQVVKQKDFPLFEFNKAIIEATKDLVCAYKPNSAFYEAEGDRGVRQLKMTCDYIKEKYPQIPIILDAKRGDIGNSNFAYAKYAFDYLGTDAITLHPYLGSEAIKLFLSKAEKGCIILCRTSNPGAKELQDVIVNGEPLYKFLAKKITKEWNKNNNCMMVIGATYPEELAEVRKIAPDMIFLIPGIGTQGGSIEKTVKAGLNSQKGGIIINSSRSIIFASPETDYSEKSREETIKLRNQINKYRI